MITVILTGGASRRMGMDKALLPVDGMAMSLMLADRYKMLGQVAFSVDRKGRFPVSEYLELEDRFPGCGPLNGLVSAFLDTEEDIAFLTATDMPEGNIQAVDELLTRLGDHDACIFAGEPLFGVYRRSCLDVAMFCLTEGERSMRSFLRRINVLEIEYKYKEGLLNLNTPKEYELFLQKTTKVMEL